MGDPTKIDFANKNFDQLYEDLQPQLEKMSGKTCYARYDAGKGLRIKQGIDNFLRLNKIMDKRGKKFADATEIFKDAINRQYPGEMVGEITLGEHLLQEVMKDHGDGDRISAPEIKELYEKLHAHADKHNLDATESNRATLSTVASSRVVQSDASIKAGKALLKEAIATDLFATHPDYKGEPAHALARADQILSRVDMRNGLTTSSYNEVIDEMAKRHPSVVLLSKTRRLLDLLDIQSKINVASRQLRNLNAALMDFVPHFKVENRPALYKAVSERRAILQDLGKLSFPDDLKDFDKISKLATRLEQNCFHMNDAMEEVDRSDFPDRENAFLHYLEQGAETLGLATALRSYAGCVDEAAGPAVQYDVLEDSLDVLSRAKVVIPKTLWTAPTRQGNDTFSDVAKVYGDALKASQSLWYDVRNNAPEASLDRTEDELKHALALNDAMLESFERAEAVRGDRAFSEDSATSSSFNTKYQRLKLNLQLVHVRALMQQDIQRAPSITPRPSVTDSEYSSTASAIEDEIAKGGSGPVSDSRRPDDSADATMKNSKRPNHDDESMVVRRVDLESSYGNIPEAHRNTLAQAGNHAHQSSNTTNDSRTRITDILNESTLSGAGGLKNPDDAPMKIASEPTSPRNAPLTSHRNPDDEVMDINSVPPSPDHQPVSLDPVPASGPNPEDSSMSIRSVSNSPAHQPVSSDTVPTSGANPEDSSFNIQSAPPSPDHQPEDASLNEFASIDGAFAGSEIDVDLYNAGYDTGNEDRVNNESPSDTGSDDEEDGSVQLP